MPSPLPPDDPTPPTCTPCCPRPTRHYPQRYRPFILHNIYIFHFPFILFFITYSAPLGFFIYISSCVAAQEFPLWWNLVPLGKTEVFLSFFFFFGRSASREAMELWTVGQTFEANLWGCFGFRLNWVCVCVICVPVSFCVAPSEAWIPLCPWLMMSYPLSCKRQSVLIHALSAAPVPLESGQIL